MHTRFFSVLKEAFRLFWTSADGPIRRRLAVALVFVIGSSALAGLAPVLIKLIVDRLSSGDALDVYGPSIFLVLIYIGTLWMSRVLTEVRSYVHGTAEQRFYRRLSIRFFDHIMRLPLRFHLERKTGAMGQTLTNGQLGFRMFIQHLVFSIVPVIAELAVMASVLIHFDHSSFLVILGISVAAYAIAFGVGVSRMTGPARAASSANVEATAVLTDSILNYETVKYFDAENQVHDRYDTVLAKSEKEWRGFFGRKASNGVLVATVFAVSLAASIGLAARGVAQGTMTVGDFVLVNTYLLQIIRPLEMLGFALRDVAQGAAYIERMLDLFRVTTETTQQSAGKRCTDIPPRLAFEDVSFAYNPDRNILSNVSFSVEPGKTVAIVGPSGSGKSSLIRLLVRLYEPDQGRILLDGVPISSMSTSDVRQAIAVVS